MQLFRRGKRNDLEFLSDSADQIAHSIDKTGVRDKIGRAFEAAIDQLGRRPQRSSELAISEAGEVDTVGSSTEEKRTSKSVGSHWEMSVQG